MSVVGSYVVVDVVISRLTIATGTAAISTSVASVRQLRRTSLIDTSRISPSASGRSCGAGAGSALIPRGSVPTGEAVPSGGRATGSGGRAGAVRGATRGAVRSRRRPRSVARHGAAAGAAPNVLDGNPVAAGGVARGHELGRGAVRHELGLERAPH